MAYQREGNAQNQNCESGKAPEEPVALLQAAKACKGHWVNKFGHWPVGIAPLPALCFPRRSQYPPKPHECEKSRLTRPRKRITMKSPKDIAKAAFMGAGFRVPFSGGLGYMIPHKIRFVNQLNRISSVLDKYTNSGVVYCGCCT